MQSDIFSSPADWSLIVRSVGALVFIASVLIAVVCLFRWQRQQSRRQAERTSRRPATSSRESQALKTLQSSANTELLSLIDLAFDGDSEVAASARAKISARPELETELGETLRSEDRVRALKYLWLYMPQSPESLARPLRDCIASMPAWMRQRFPAGGMAHSTEFEWACRAIPRLAERLAHSGVEFRSQIQQLAEFIRSQQSVDTVHYLVLLEGVGAAETQRKPRLGMMLWEDARTLSNTPANGTKAATSSRSMAQNPLAS